MSVLESKLIESWPPDDWRDVTVLVAVSGGADSVALLRALAAIRESGSGSIVVAHLNHRMREMQSAKDADFVADLAHSIGLRCELGEARRKPVSEDDARKARYAFLERAARANGARFVVTAHTANDQAETVMHRIVRGTGLGGLRGIPRVRELIPGISIIRPMLAVTRDDVLTYLRARGQTYRDDASNASPRFTRNRLRHELLPHLADHYNANIIDALLRLSDLSRETLAFIGAEVRRSEEICVVARDKDSLTLDCKQLLERGDFLPSQLLRSLWEQQGWPLRRMTYPKWKQIVELCGQTSSRPISIHLPGNIRATKNGDLLRLSRPPKTDSVNPAGT